MGVAVGFLLVVTVGSASAGVTPTSNPETPVGTEPDVELALAVVVAASADSLDTNAVARLSASREAGVERGTAFQLTDGRIATVAHAIIDARRVRIDEGSGLEITNTATNPDVAISRLHDLAAIRATNILPGALEAAPLPAEVGQQVTLGGIPKDGRLSVVTGEIISRTDGTDYGIGRPDVYVIAAPVERGWSGGPVVDAFGNVVAVVVGSETRTGVTLAVPIEYLPTP